MVLEVRYKLRMLGMSLEKTSLMLGDNMSVILNTIIPSSMLKKKHNAIAYHRVRELIASKTINFAHVPLTANIADVLTKPLNSEIIHGLMKEYMFKKPKTVAGLVRRVNTIMEVPLDREVSDPTLALIDGGANVCILGLEFELIA